MTQLTKEDLQNVVREVLDERNAIGGEMHHNDHEFIKFLKRQEERKQARIEKFKMSIIGGVAMTLLGVIIWVGKLVIANVHWN